MVLFKMAKMYGCACTVVELLEKKEIWRDMSESSMIRSFDTSSPPMRIDRLFCMITMRDHIFSFVVAIGWPFVQ
jgi:hypothetical protein